LKSLEKASPIKGESLNGRMQRGEIPFDIQRRRDFLGPGVIRDYSFGASVQLKP